MLKTMSTTLLLVILSPAYIGAYAISRILKLKDAELMESPADFLLMAFDQYHNDTAEEKYIKKLAKQVERFYQEAIFMPAPSIINLYDTECVARIIDDMTLLGEDKSLIEELRRL